MPFHKTMASSQWGWTGELLGSFQPWFPCWHNKNDGTELDKHEPGQNSLGPLVKGKSMALKAHFSIFVWHCVVIPFSKDSITSYYLYLHNLKITNVLSVCDGQALCWVLYTCYFILPTTILWGRYYYLHFTGEEDRHRKMVTCPVSPN